MKSNSSKTNLYFYKWDRQYMDAAVNSDRVTCSIREFDYDDNLEDFKKLRNSGTEVFAFLPVLWKAAESDSLDEYRSLIDGLYVGNIGQVDRAKEAGVRIIADVGLNVFNSEAVELLTEKGLEGAVVSYELAEDTFDFVSEITGVEPCRSADSFPELEVLKYGRVPAMISEYCPLAGAEGIKGNNCGLCMENNPVFLKDTFGDRYPVIPDSAGCTSMILSKNPLNRKNCAKAVKNYINGVERITVFDESPNFIIHLLKSR